MRERAGYKRNSKGKLTPRNGKVIGFIYKDEFIDLTSFANELGPCSSHEPFALKGYGAARLIYEEGQQIAASILKTYTVEDSETIMAIAALRIMLPSIACNRYMTHYVSSWVSKFWPHARMSTNAISKFINKLGQQPDRFERVFEDRITNVAPDHVVLIDGCLKQDSSEVNTLSKTSFKTAIKGHKEISIMYAYDFTLKEILCVQTFLGNTLDANAFSTFVEAHKLIRGIIVADKGFPVSRIRHILKANPDLHYILPLRRNSSVIAQLQLLDVDLIVERSDRRVAAKKVKVADNLFYYAFIDFGRANKELNSAFDQILRSKGDPSFLKKRGALGSIVFESDLDLPVELILDHYDNRWELETIFDHYKNTLDLDMTRLQGDFSVLGNEFINFVSTVIEWRISRRFDVLNQESFLSFRERMTLLMDAHRRTNGSLMTVTRSDGTWANLNVQTKQAFILMEQLGLMPPESDIHTSVEKTAFEVTEPRKKAGRPKGSLNKATVERMAKETVAREQGVAIEEKKRNRGRPKGSLNKATLERLAKEAQDRADGSYVEPVKRGRGRPKGSLNKTTLERLAKDALARVDAKPDQGVKRGRGRPKGSLNKATLVRLAEEAQAKVDTPHVEPIKRGRGRPKGSLNKTTLARLAKEAIARVDGSYVEPVKRGRGRPKGSLNRKTIERLSHVVP